MRHRKRNGKTQTTDNASVHFSDNPRHRLSCSALLPIPNYCEMGISSRAYEWDAVLPRYSQAQLEQWKETTIIHTHTPECWTCWNPSFYDSGCRATAAESTSKTAGICVGQRRWIVISVQKSSTPNDVELIQKSEKRDHDFCLWFCDQLFQSKNCWLIST